MSELAMQGTTPRTLNPELAEYRRQFQAIRHDAEDLAVTLTPEQFVWRPGPGRWSVSECIEHLNLCGEQMALPAIDRLIEEARTRGLRSAGPYRHGGLGTWFIRTNEPPVKMKAKTFRRFNPSTPPRKQEVMAHFLGLHDQLEARLESASGLDLGAVRARLPLLIPLSLGQWFAFTAAHERRHLWQARQVMAEAGITG